MSGEQSVGTPYTEDQSDDDRRSKYTSKTGNEVKLQIDDEDRAENTSFIPDDFNRQDKEMEVLINHKNHISEDNVQTLRECIVTGKFVRFDAKQAMVVDSS